MLRGKTECERLFAYEEESNTKLARLGELNTQLDLENGRVEDIDLGSADKELDCHNTDRYRR